MGQTWGLSRVGNQGSKCESEYKGQEGALEGGYIVCVQPNISFSGIPQQTT